MKIQVISLALVTAFALIRAPALAADGDHPCKSEIEKNCPGTESRQGRAVIKCLAQHEATLSAACKTKIHALKGQFRHARESCHDDVEKLCADVSPGRGALTKCLVDQLEKLSPDCKASFEQARSRHRGKK